MDSVWIIILGVFFLAFLLAFYVFVREGRRKSFDSKAQVYIRSHWIRIIDSFEADPARAVLDADKLLDYALGKCGFEGSVGEKLKKAGPRFSDLSGIWKAHKLRNKLAHEFVDLKKEDAKKALGRFKRGLNDLGAGL